MVVLNPDPRKLGIDPPSGSPAKVPMTGSVPSLLIMVNASPTVGVKPLNAEVSRITPVPIVTVPGDVDLVVIGIGSPRGSAANLNRIGAIIGKGQVAGDRQDTRGLSRRDCTLQCHSIGPGVNVSACHIIDGAPGDRDGVGKGHCINLDRAGPIGGIADRDAAESIAQEAQLRIV